MTQTLTQRTLRAAPDNVASSSSQGEPLNLPVLFYTFCCVLNRNIVYSYKKGSWPSLNGETKRKNVPVGTPTRNMEPNTIEESYFYRVIKII